MVYVDKRTYHAIKNALQPAEKELIKFYELNWHLKQQVPTVEEVTQHLRKKYSKLRQTSVNYYLNRQPVIKKLEQLGIPFRNHTREELTDAQHAAALTVMNFADERSIAEKLDQLGITSLQYYAWLKDPAFKNFLDSLADQNKVNIRPAAVSEFTKKVQAGDWNAIRYFMDVTGEFASNAPQGETLLRMIIEIIQKHVKDPATIIAIAQDIKLAAANKTLEVVAQPSIESYVVEDDIDLESARKQLGV